MTEQQIERLLLVLGAVFAVYVAWHLAPYVLR